AISQPDLNWENPRVREEMMAVVDFWVNLGVDGFRCDVLDQISKDFVNNKNGNGPRLHEYIRQLFGRPEVDHIFTVGECWGAKPENVKQLIGGDRGELSTLFQFEHINLGYGHGGRFKAEPLVLDEVRRSLVKWQNIMQDNQLVGTLFLENHDQPRCVSKYGNDTVWRYESATLLATMCYLQKGIPFIYQGQEIGTANYYSENINDFRDIETLNYYNEHMEIPKGDLMEGINYGSRDNSRHPMSWSADEYAGFSTQEPWIPVYNRYKEINVEKDMASEQSIYKYFKQLIALRLSSDAFINGTYEDITGDRTGVYIYRRNSGNECYVVVCNFENEQNLALEIAGEVVLSNTGRKAISGSCKPYECFVIKCR
ncbi:MAG: glucohydrolase, partial [Roseburia sp.]|nr:glucohydrolase [Roseburia sp.]